MRLPLLALIGAVLLIFGIHAGLYGAVVTYYSRPFFVMMIVISTIMFYPTRLERLPWLGHLFDLAVILAAVVPSMFLMLYWEDLIWEAYLLPRERVLAALLLLAVVETARRTAAFPLVAVMAVFVVYARYGAYFPGILGHAGVTWENILRIIVVGADGLYGSPIGFAVDFIIVFVFFAALLNASGASTHLLALATSIAGGYRGGAAKVAVVGSATMGMVSGSGITNVMTTGSITIPMMKRMGYSPQFAAAVEAVASQGSQFVPPILGAAVFLMAMYTQTPFLQLAAYCLVPAWLYYLSAFSQVHFRAGKLDMSGLPRSQLPPFWPALLRSTVALGPIALLLVLLFYDYSIAFAITIAFFAMLVTTSLSKETRILTDHRKAQEGLTEGIRALAAIGSALALAGVVVGMILLTGLGARLTTLIGTLAGDSLFLVLLCTAIVCIVLGMGVVTVGAYVIVASLTAPLLTSFEVPLVIAHLFIFYYATLSGLTPPVAVVSFAAAGIANAPGMSVAILAVRLGFIAWLIPFIFVYDPAIIGFHGLSVWSVVHIATASLGVIAAAAALEGFIFKIATPLERMLIGTGAAILIAPVSYFLPVAFVLLVLAAFLNGRRRDDAAAGSGAAVAKQPE